MYIYKYRYIYIYICISIYTHTLEKNNWVFMPIASPVAQWSILGTNHFRRIRVCVTFQKSGYQTKKSGSMRSIL